MTTTAKINKANRELAEQLNTILKSNIIEYDYNYIKGHYVNGYDGEPGFDLEDRRTGHLYLEGYGYVLSGQNSSYKKDFRVFTFEEFYQKIQEDLIEHPNWKILIYVKMILDEYIYPSKNKKNKQKLKI